MKVKIPTWKSFQYVEVFKILEMRDDCVYRTESLGFAKADRAKKDDEIYASISTFLLKEDFVELDLIEN